MRALLALLGAMFAISAQCEPDFGGTWILTNGGKQHAPVLTAYGASFKSSYDFKNDDPSLLCIPASWARVFANPNTPFEITQNDAGVRIRHELFDIDRTVPLSPDFMHDRGEPKYSTLGDSVAWYDGDDLLIHTINYGDETRVLSTIRNWAGLPQSPLMVTLERYRIEDGRLLLEITHYDPIMYAELLVASYQFRRETEWTVEHYGCDPDWASVVTPKS